MHSPSTLKVAERLGTLGTSALLLIGAGLGVSIVPAETPMAVDLLLAVGSALSVGAAVSLGGVLGTVSSLPLEIAPVASRGASRGQPVYRFRARLGRGRTLTEPQASVRWRADSGDEVALEPWVPGSLLCGPFTFLAHDPQRRVQGAGHFVVTLRVRSGGQAWSAEQHIGVDDVVEGPFDGVELHRRGVRFTESWQRVTAPLETHVD